MYKLTHPDGFDFYSSTINYREAIGTTIRIKDYEPKDFGVCGRGLHASKNPNDCFVGAKIPCAAFHVEGVNKIAGDKVKTRYQGLKIIEEITDLDELFGWNYSEAINLINPFKIKAPEVDENVLQLLKEWNSVYNSIKSSICSSVCISAYHSVYRYGWSSIRTSVWDSVRNLIWHSAEEPVYAYIGSLFPNIKKWESFKHKKGVYPFQSGADLWKMGFVPSFNGKVWRLHIGRNAKVVWEGGIKFDLKS